MTIFNPPPGGRILEHPGRFHAASSGISFPRLADCGFPVFWRLPGVDSGADRLDTVGRVTGEALPEGIHLINPLKTNHELSIRTQEIKETASVRLERRAGHEPDTSLICTLNPEKAADVFQKIGPNYVEVLIEPNHPPSRKSTAACSPNGASSSVTRPTTSSAAPGALEKKKQRSNRLSVWTNPARRTSSRSSSNR